MCPTFQAKNSIKKNVQAKNCMYPATLGRSVLYAWKRLEV
jgi:hypothetical protein